MLFLSRVVYLLGLGLFTSTMSHIQIDLIVKNQDGNSGVVPEELLDERIGNLNVKISHIILLPFFVLSYRMS